MKIRIISTILICLFSVALALGEQPQSATSGDKQGPQSSFGYLYQRSQGTFGGKGFGLNGGRADVLLPFTRNFGLVAEFSGVRTGGIPGAGTGLTLLTYMAGPRFSVPLRRTHEAGRVVPFAQVLLGGAHASDGLFPTGSSVSSTANSFAMSAGGGMQVGVTQRLSVRVIQAEYLYTRLPNLFDSYQNSYRIGAGVVFRLR
jgi:outer membrane immunogenic protein